MIELTEEQSAALNGVLGWLGEGTQECSLGGLAGTGKTTLVTVLVEQLRQRRMLAGVVALSGKAASVLRKKGVEATTIHKLIYTPIDNGDGTVDFLRKDKVDNAIFLVDEASMVDSKIKADILKFGRPVLWVGDHGQLEPVGDDPCIMHDPRFRLETVMRQALESPITRFAHRLRLGESFVESTCQPSLSVMGGRLNLENVYEGDYDQVIVGLNKTRHEYNRLHRRRAGFEGPLCINERVIFLRNNYLAKVFNGQVGVVKTDPKLAGNFAWFDCEVDGRVVPIKANVNQFGVDPLARTSADQEFREVCFADYAYAVTCHKAQGSEWGSVCVVEQIAREWDPRRWSYTAATRAKTHLTYFTNREGVT